MPLLERGSRLETGEVRTETVMHAVTQGEMTGEPTMNIEAFRINELAIIMIRGSPQEHHARIGWDGDSMNGDLTGGLTRKHLHRRVAAQQFLDRSGPQRFVCNKLGSLGRIRREEHEPIADQARRGVISGEDQQHAEPEQFGVLQAATVEFGVEQCRHHVVGRLCPTGLQ